MSYGKQNEKELITRYAKALFALAKESKQLDVVEKDMEGVSSLIVASPELRQFIKNPLLSRAMQERAIQAILEKAGFSVVVRHFCSVLARNRRLGLLAEMAKEFQVLLSHYRDEVVVQVVTAVALRQEQQAVMIENMSGALRKKIKLQTSVDPSILGGVIVKVGSKMLDAALSSRLEKLRVISKKAVSTL